MNRFLIISVALFSLFFYSCQEERINDCVYEKGQVIITDTLAFLHNRVLDNLLSLETRSGVSKDPTMDSYLLDVVNALQKECDNSEIMHCLDTCEIEEIRTLFSSFVSMYDKYGLVAGCHYINTLPLPQSVINGINDCFLDDIASGTHTLLDYLSSIAQGETGFELNHLETIRRMYFFYSDDIKIWNKHTLLTRGGDDRGFACDFIDVGVGLAVSACNFFVATAVSILASKTVQFAPYPPKGPLEWTNCD